MFSHVIERELLTIIEHAAEKGGESPGQFIVKAIMWALSRLETETAQERKEVAA